TLLLAARDDEGGPPLDDAEIRDQLLTLLAAGHETTAMALSWALYWIHSTPDVCGRLRDELAEFARDRDPERAARLPYLDAICRESLRLYPVIPVVGRRVHEELEIGGVRIPPETNVMVSIFLTHHREELYPEPESFRPDRFLGRRFSP